MAPRRIAFYAPLKAPDHPVPSGDRQMARLLVAALRAGGHAVEVASTFRTFLPDPEPRLMREVESGAAREAERVGAAWRQAVPPDLWFTYHSHYKAPDLLGPIVAARFGLPLVVAEASHAGKRAHGPWSDWHALNAAAIRAADLHLCFTRRDAEGLGGLVAPDRTAMLPPFIAGDGYGPAVPRWREGGRVELVAVAMMRAGDKARSYGFLAEALAALPPDLAWRLTLVGDGPDRPAVEAMFQALPAARLAWAGQQDAAGVASALAASDLYVWPGFAEAYGIAYLEAQAAGLPVLAMDCGGIASVVADRETGILTPQGDGPAYVAALARLIGDPALRERLGAAGRRLVLGERTLAHAARRLDAALGRVGVGAAA